MPRRGYSGGKLDIVTEAWRANGEYVRGKMKRAAFL